MILQVCGTGAVLTLHAALVINTAICDLITDKTDLGERSFTFQHNLLSKFFQLHSLCQLADGDRIVQEVLCVGKIRIIRPVAADRIIAGDVGKKLAQNVFMCLPCDGRTLWKDTILQQDRDPVQDMATMLKEKTPVDGTEAFKLLKAAFDDRTKQLRQQADAAGKQLSHVFIFCEEVFDEGQEMLILVTELTISYYGAHFINRYGCKEYFAHNKELLFYERQKEIITELEKLEMEE